MILIDTSVWIDYFNNIVNLHSKVLDMTLVEGTAAIGDIIFLEILQGFKSDKDYKNTKTQLSKLDRYEMFGHQMVEPCANNYRSLRKKGITIRNYLHKVLPFGAQTSHTCLALKVVFLYFHNLYRF